MANHADGHNALVSETPDAPERKTAAGWRRQLRRVAVLLLGGALIVAGIVMIALPGPAFVVIPIGLAVLATEFEIARRWRDSLLRFIQRRYALARSRRRSRPPTERPPTVDPLRDRPM